jgi:hypothetical protein
MLGLTSDEIMGMLHSAKYTPRLPENIGLGGLFLPVSIILTIFCTILTIDTVME